MTQQQKTIRKERHIVVDLILMIGTGLLAVAYDHRSWSSCLFALGIVVLGLWLDRSNALQECEEEDADCSCVSAGHDCHFCGRPKANTYAISTVRATVFQSGIPQKRCEPTNLEE